MRVLFLSLLASSALSTTALAQEAVDAPDAGLDNGEIIVTAQKRAERLQDVPISVMTQTAEQLTNAGVTTTADLSKVVPGVIFAQNESYSQPAIRGVTTNISAPGTETPNAIYLDGIYQPTQAGVLFDLPDVERIEVLKGPQGTLFGRNATGGAIQIFTRNPTYELSGKVSLTGARYMGKHARDANEVQANGFISGGLIDGVLAASVSGYYRHNQGYMTDDVTGRRVGSQESYGGRVKLLWEPADNAKFVLSGYYGHLMDHATYQRTVFKGQATAASFPDAVIPTEPWHVSNAPNRPEPYLKNEVYGGALRGDIEFDIGTLTLLSGYNYAKNFNFVNSATIYSPACIAANRCTFVPLGAGGEAFSQEINFVTKKLGMFSLSTGLFYYKNFGSYQTVDVFSTDPNTLLTFYQSSVKTSAYAAFGELNADITDNLHVIAGVRYSREKKHADGSNRGVPVNIEPMDDDAFTPRFSVRYELDNYSNVYLTYSKGFRSGVLSPPAIVPLSNTKPEKIRAWELGFKTARRDYALNVAFYAYKYTDMQQQVFITVAAAFPRNAGASEMYGVDVDGRLNLTPDLTLTGAFNYMPVAKFTEYEGALFLTPNPAGFGPPVATVGSGEGIRLLRAPEFSGTLGLNWAHEYGFGKLGGSAMVYHTSAYNWDNAGTIKTKAYQDVSATFYYEPASSGLRFTAFVKNLLNKAAVSGAQPSGPVLPVLYIPPRQVGLTISYNF